MIRRLRLISSLVMLAYVTMHLANHAMGLVSLDAMARTLAVVEGIWATPLGLLLLYGGFAVHYALALWALWERRSLRLPPPESLQIALGFAIPFLLMRHVAGTRIAASFFGADRWSSVRVNTASRLESLTKEHLCDLVVSEEVVSRAGVDLVTAPRREIQIRGRREPLTVRLVEDAASLPAPPLAPVSAPAAAARSLP